MHYPWWYVPLLNAPMLIAIIAVVHVVVSHYAVGGGLFLAFETRHAYRTGNQAYLGYLRQHAWFFVLLTVAFGAITGVGIWWIIGLASPLATEVLIHNFVFGWAMEYVFFVLEIASAFIFLYYWGRLDPQTHQLIGWIYAGAAWISLVLITGITGFMLHPGGWVEHPGFWSGFLNPQFVPQTIARTGGSLLLASLYVYLHVSFKVSDQNLKKHIERRSARPALWGAAMVVIGGLWVLAAMPESARAALETAAPLNILMGLIFAVTIGVFVMLYLGPYRNPGWLSPGFAIMLLACGMAAVGSGEFIREAVRKPYISYNVVLSNQVLAAEVPQLQDAGYLESGAYTRAWMRGHYPQVFDGEYIEEAALLALPRADRLAVGEVLFMYHCNDCHAAEVGMSAISHLTRGWDRQQIGELVRHPERAQFFMPPWCGTDDEAQLLTDWIESIAPHYPRGMYYGKAGEE